MRTDGPDEIIIETTRIGAYLKCSAVHVASGVEVSVSGPVTQSKALETVAVAKLRRALAR